MMYNKITLQKYLEMVASATPTPGGGSVSAYAAALASALGSMTSGIALSRVVRHSSRPLRDNEIRGEILPNSKNYHIVKEAQKVFHRNYLRLLQLAESDSLAYDKVCQAYKLPHYLLDRRRKINSALKYAAEIPYQVMCLCQENLDTILEIRKLLPVQILSDINVAVLLTRAAYDGARLNCLVNVESIGDKKASRKIEKNIEELEQTTAQTILWLDDWM